jgi:hypothetical protein
MVDALAVIYAKHLVPITNLIHSKPKNRVQDWPMLLESEGQMNDRRGFYTLCTSLHFFVFVCCCGLIYRSRYKLLLWGSVCFLGSTLDNGLLATDKLLL